MVHTASNKPAKQSHLQISPVAVVMEPTERLGWAAGWAWTQVEKHGKKKTGKTGTPWNTMEKMSKTHIIYSSLEFQKPSKSDVFVGRP